MPLKSSTRTRRAVLRASAVAGAGAVVALTAGCSNATLQRGYLPGDSQGEVTNQTADITQLWVGSWVAALAVGLITWGLILWCVAAYRKRRDDHRLPVQTRYHLPLEIMYTVVPTLMILALFWHTDRVMTAVIEPEAEPDIHIGVIGKQWSWDFNYLDEGVYEYGEHVPDPGGVTDEHMVDGAPGTDVNAPTLYLPVGKSVEFRLDSRDVNHSFWIPAFLYKEDMIPHHTNYYQVTPTREGTYAGKCAELCGEFHSGMLFNVKVVSQEEFDAHMEELRAAGQVGELGIENSRQQGPINTEEAEH